MNRFQEIADTIINHLRQQKVMATENGMCCYLTRSGLKCAAGCLIPPEDYQVEFEGRGILETGRPVNKYFTSKYSPAELSLISKFQKIHDGFWEGERENQMSVWEDSWRALAQETGLYVYTPPKEMQP